jgi:hypothetical protein
MIVAEDCVFPNVMLCRRVSSSRGFETFYYIQILDPEDENTIVRNGSNQVPEIQRGIPNDMKLLELFLFFITYSTTSACQNINKGR